MERIAVLQAELARCHEERNAITQREALFQLFCDGAQDYAFVILDLENRVIGWSRGAECILGYSNAEILGECGSILFTPEDASTDEVNRELLLAQLQNRTEFERWHRRKDGSRFWGSGVMVPLRDAAGQQQGFGKIFRDLTARKEREDRLTASLKERDLLLREIHHRVKNNLQVITSLISLQTRLNPSTELRVSFEELAGRVRAIGALHETLYSSPVLGSLLFGSYMEGLLRELQSVHGVDPHRIKLHVKAADVVIHVEQALPLGLILNEVTTNCLKHAFPGERQGVVTLSLDYLPAQGDERLNEGDCELSVSDNGIGLAAGREMQDLPSVGLYIVELLVGELGGTFHLNNQATGGTKFTLRFPLQLRDARSIV